MFKIILIILLILNDNSLDDIESVLIKSDADNLKRYSDENRVQIDYLLETSFQENSIINADIKLLKSKGWKICQADGYGWQTYLDNSTNPPYWISDKVIRFYNKSNEFITVAMRHKERIKFDKSLKYKQNIIILYDFYSDALIEESMKNGIIISECLVSSKN